MMQSDDAKRAPEASQGRVSRAALKSSLAMSISRIGVVVTADRKDMTADWVPSQISLDPQSGRILDTARGILIGLRRCRSEAAFQELLVAAQRHRAPRLRHGVGACPSDGMKERGLRSSCPFRARMLGVLTFIRRRRPL